ncbi:MAG: SMC family ATPase [Dehalococcoidia bacterium]|nr:SMC family ATPase [Dehalococcoidia bacterium]
MKPLRLELRGFTAFRRPTVVDFTGRTLFAITGPTGAGKSSLLDAMTWALYGQVPRVGRATHQLVTHGEKSMSVRFDFSARGHTYRVTRTTAGAIGTRLEQAVEGEHWRLVADRATEVTKAIQTLVGLDYATFTKTIVLPQGEFGSFLRGDERERREILSTLLGLGAYEAVGRAARGRAKEAAQSRDLLARQLDRLNIATPEGLAALEAEHVALEGRHATTEVMRVSLAALEEVGSAYLEQRRLHEEATRLAESAERACTDAERALLAAAAETRAAQAAQAALVQERADVRYDPDAHRRLREAAQLLEVRVRAATALDVARHAETSARSHVESAGAALQAAQAQATVQAEAGARAAADLDAATAELKTAVSDAHDASRALAAAEVASEAAATIAEARATERARAADQIGAFVTQARAIEAERAASDDALHQARAALEAAHALETGESQRIHDAEAQATRARSILAEVHTQHAASAVRASLSPGDLCPVCGGTVSQLQLTVEPDLSEADAAVTAAERLVREAFESHRTAAAAVARCSAHLAAVESEADRRRTREAALVTSLATVTSGTDLAGPAVATDQHRADALDGLAAVARTEASEAQSSAQEHRARLGQFRDARHKLDIRVTEAATRLDGWSPPGTQDVSPCEDLKHAREAVRALARCVERHVALSAAAVGALELQRRTQEEARRAADLVEEADRALVLRRAAVEAATLEIAALPDIPAALGAETDLRAALAEADRLAAVVTDLEVRAQRAATEVAVLVEREQERTAQARARNEDARVAAATREESATASSAAAARFAEDWGRLLGTDATPDVAAVRALARDVEAEARTIAAGLGGLRERIDRARQDVEEGARIRTEIEASEAIGRVAGALERELHADRFIAYVQREALAVLAADASSRLLHLTGGRYRLVGESDEFFVVDHLNGEERRSVRTLSGGETFLASLALALALSERLPELAGAGGAMSLESLFLDEGFGSLDAASLDVAIEGLERLAGGRRLIGVISHVPEIAERLPDRIDVIKAPEGSSIAGGG